MAGEPKEWLYVGFASTHTVKKTWKGYVNDFLKSEVERSEMLIEKSENVTAGRG